MTKFNFIVRRIMSLPHLRSKRMNYQLVFLLIFLIYLAGYLLIRDNGLHVDEFHYYDQIMRFTRRDFMADPVITVIPGYHLMVALIARVFQQYSISFIRLISFFLNWVSIPIFYLVSRKLDSKHAMLKTLQYSFFPLFFPFFPLIYTDIFSITTILLSLFFVLRKQYNVAGLLGFFTLLVRQNNIIWLILLVIISYYQEYGSRLRQDFIKRHFYRMRIFVIVFLLFAEFIIVNGGLVWGNKAGYPVNYFSLGNIYFMYFLSFVLFLPVLLLNFAQVSRLILKHKYVFGGAVFMFYAIFIMTFTVTHPWNRGNFQLHNLILAIATANNLTKSIFFLPVVYAVVSLAVTPLYRSYYAWTYPLGILVVLSAWIIEQRYYMVFFALFLLFRKYTSRRREVLMLIFYMFASVYLFDGILHWKFFL